MLLLKMLQWTAKTKQTTGVSQWLNEQIEALVGIKFFASQLLINFS